MVRNVLCVPRVRSQHRRAEWPARVFQTREWAKARPVQHSKRTGSKHVVGRTEALFCGHWGTTTVFKQGSHRTEAVLLQELNWQNIQRLTAERATWLFYHRAPLHPHQTWLCSRSAPLLSSPPPQPALTTRVVAHRQEHHTGRVTVRRQPGGGGGGAQSSFPAHQQGSQEVLQSLSFSTQHSLSPATWWDPNRRERERISHQLLNAFAQRWYVSFLLNFTAYSRTRVDLRDTGWWLFSHE